MKRGLSSNGTGNQVNVLTQRGVLSGPRRSWKCRSRVLCGMCDMAPYLVFWATRRGRWFRRVGHLRRRFGIRSGP